MVIERHIVPQDAVIPSRLSDYAVGIFATLTSRKGVKKAIKRGEIIVNGNNAETGQWIEVGQVIELISIDRRPGKIFKLDIDLVYEDDLLAVVNKPAGYPVSGNTFKTVQNALPGIITPSGRPDKLLMPLPVHRLDRATSGLLIIAKCREARIRLGEMFENRSISKHYMAIVIGKTPDFGYIDQRIDKKRAFTTYRNLRTVRALHGDYLSLLEIEPRTGRTHQIRRHLADIGFPILGDPKYGTQGLILKGKGLFLAAVGLRFSHPIVQREIKLDIQPPSKFNKRLDYAESRWLKFRS